jgi:23S rRNA-/tRNA-specific pseudouridylate synthase
MHMRRGILDSTTAWLLPLLFLLVSISCSGLASSSAASSSPSSAAAAPPGTFFFTGGSDTPVLRHVKPYHHSFRSNAKGRWHSRGLFEVFTSEFAAHSADYYRGAIAEGRITVNGAAVGPDYIIRDGDLIEHATLRREPPVLGCGPGQREAIVVADTATLLVVDKPSSVPMHACGAYHYNSLLPILRDLGCSSSPSSSSSASFSSSSSSFSSNSDDGSNDSGSSSGELHVVHRLDRLTSGLTILAKDAGTARAFGEDLTRGHTAKTYLARVKGDFGVDDFPNVAHWQRSPEDLLYQASDGGGSDDSKASESHGTTLRKAGWAFLPESPSSSSPSSLVVRVQQPIGCVSRRDGLYECSLAPTRTTTDDEDDDDHRHHHSSRAAATTTTAKLNRYGMKEAATVFRKLSFNGRTSLVEATPLHGRTHQIRLHLQFLGHPIANDPRYGGALHCGRDGSGCIARHTDDDPSSEEQQLQCACIWLHALRYERRDQDTPERDWAFETPLPPWAWESVFEGDLGME